MTANNYDRIAALTARVSELEGALDASRAYARALQNAGNCTLFERDIINALKLESDNCVKVVIMDKDGRFLRSLFFKSGVEHGVLTESI